MRWIDEESRRSPEVACNLPHKLHKVHKARYWDSALTYVHCKVARCVKVVFINTSYCSAICLYVQITYNILKCSYTCTIPAAVKASLSYINKCHRVRHFTCTCSVQEWDCNIICIDAMSIWFSTRSVTLFSKMLFVHQKKLQQYLQKFRFVGDTLHTKLYTSTCTCTCTWTI